MKHIKLFESYQSQKEIELLSSIILDKMINKALINNTVSLSSFPKIKFSDIEISNFDVLKDFLREPVRVNFKKKNKLIIFF